VFELCLADWFVLHIITQIDQLARQGVYPCGVCQILNGKRGTVFRLINGLHDLKESSFAIGPLTAQDVKL
jgi:hypothetical protein